jgi:phage terminase small subunit
MRSKTIAMPAGLDKEAKRKFREMVLVCDPDTDPEAIANYARQFSILVSIRRERAKQEAAGIFSTMVAGRDATQVLNPLIVGENRAIAALSRMLKGLGLTNSREEQGARRKAQPNPAPPGMTGPEPPWGWAIEQALCGDEKDFYGGKDDRKKAN